MINFHEFQLKISKLRIKFRLLDVLLSLPSKIQLNNRCLFRFVFRPNCLHSSKNRKLLNCYVADQMFPKILLPFVNRAVFSNENDSGSSYGMKACRIQPAKNVLNNVVVFEVNMPSDDDTSNAKVPPGEWNIFVFVYIRTHLAHITPESE